MNKKMMKYAAICFAGSMYIAAHPLQVNASNASGSLPGAGLTVAFNECEVTSDVQLVQATAEEVNPPVQSEYANLAIAQVNDYVNCRNIPSEDGEVVGKLYNNSAGTILGVEGEWYHIQSGSVDGYVKGQYVATGDYAAQLAAQVGRRVATVTTTTLKVREQPGTDAPVLGLIPIEDVLDVTEELDGWVKVSIEEGEGYVSTDYVTLSTVFVQAESKAEEEARLAKEEAEREAAAAATAAAKSKKATSSSKSKSSSSSSSAPADSAPASSNGQAIANYAVQFVGNPYVYGGTSLTNGADCSGFIMSVYAHFGISLPHSSSALRGVGYEVSLADAQPGDILCYSGHAAIYIGNNSVVHASTAATGIKISSPANYRNVITVRRIY